MKYFDIELIDRSENVENFKFNKISDKDLKSILDSFSSPGTFLSFMSVDVMVILERDSFRGIMYTEHVAPKLNTIQENKEDSKEVARWQDGGSIDEDKDPKRFSRAVAKEKEKQKKGGNK